MMYLLKYLQRAGIVSTLLIVGVVGGLVAALPSQAQITNVANPSLTIQVEWTHTVSMAGTNVTVIDKLTTPASIPFTLTGPTVACSSTEGTGPGGLGYTHCYPITIGNATTGPFYGPCNATTLKCRKFWVGNTVGKTNGGPAKFYVADSASTNLEKFTVSNMVLNPAPSTDWVNTTCTDCGEKVVVTIEAKNTFNLNPNDPSPSSTTAFYQYGVSVNGQFTACVVALTCGTKIINPVNDEMQMRGSGIFTTGGPNLPIDYTNGKGSQANTDCTSLSTTWPFCPGTIMYKKIGATDDTSTKFDLKQGNTAPQDPLAEPGYPHFKCSNNWSSSNPATITDPVTGNQVLGSPFKSPKCTPTITQTYYFKIFGPDTLIWWTSMDGSGLNCGTPGADKCDCTKSPLQCADKEITDFFQSQLQRHNNATPDIKVATACDPDTICNGTIIVELTTTPNAQSSGCGLPPDQSCNKFNFNADGPDVDAFTITTNPTTGFGQSVPFTHVFTGQGGHARVITTSIQPPKDANGSQWQIDQWQVFSPNGALIQGVHYDFISGPNGTKPGVILHFVPNSWEVHVSSHGHNCAKSPCI